MDNRSLAAAVQALALDAAALNQHAVSGLAQRLADYADDGLSAGRPGRSSPGGHSDPTAAAALGARRRDVATGHRAVLVAHVAAAHRAVAAALALAELYPEAHEAEATDRAALARLNGAEPGCRSCARTTGPAGGPRWEPPDARYDGHATDLGGILDEPWLLCRWCTDTTKRWGRLPTPAEVERHHRVGRVPWPADVDRPA